MSHSDDLYLGKTSYQVLGQRPVRHDGADKVTGKAIYAADVQLPNMAHGKVVRSPHAHARIKSIDASEAPKTPGVFAVVTAADYPSLDSRSEVIGEGGAVNLAHMAANCLAMGKVLYKGHPVAAVAAANVHLAEEAAAKIKVEYEVLPSVTWVLDAMKDDAPILHEDLRTEFMGKKGEQPTNVALHLQFEKGNIAEGFQQADVVIEREFRTASVHQGYIEPHATVALWNEDDRLKIWASTQGAFNCRQQVAELLQIPVSQCLVVPCEIGGGFGGKIAVYLEPVAALLSRKCGRPVKLVMHATRFSSRPDPLQVLSSVSSSGATKNGKLIAGEAWLAYDCAAFPGGVIGPGCMCVFSCYELPNARVDGFDVLDNKPKTQAYRAPGATQAAFACEQVIDELADRLGIDPLEFRLLNAAREGTRRVDGPVYPRVGMVECLQAAKNSDHWNSPLPGADRGRGIAAGFWFNMGLAIELFGERQRRWQGDARRRLDRYRRHATSVAMQLAETLGIGAGDVLPQVGDTDSVGFTFLTGGSRTTFATGLAAHKLGLDLLEQMKERAAAIWECEPAAVEATHGVFRHNGHSFTFKELAAKVSELGLDPVVGRASVSPEGSTNAFGVHIADVEVDRDTGKVNVLRYTAIQDAGKAVHPSYVEGQMQGGVVQGIGWALNEEYFFDTKDQMRNASFLDYRMPTCLDVPMIETIIVEVPNPSHPYGVRGVGETPIVPPPATIANAIHQATAVRMTQLPMSPPALWKALSKHS